MSMMYMQMYFYTSCQVTILFKKWTIEEGDMLGFSLSLIAIFLFTIFYEFFRHLKAKIIKDDLKNYKENYESIRAINVIKRNKTLFLINLKHALLYTIYFILSYLLMLIVMTFNVGIFVCAFLGIFIGYFIFSNLSASSEDSESDMDGGCH
eukprot:TRINITY_DN452_c0_g2_i1.p1 TRINITY_DN452_c0_g2~~TRINITY_DN452_c0_g2_i1.p1  ORF type:complete len:151 (-),score=11.05 TRINITY_DN452_c0_g2_i1:55-507(-)